MNELQTVFGQVFVQQFPVAKQEVNCTNQKQIETNKAHNVQILVQLSGDQNLPRILCFGPRNRIHGYLALVTLVGK